MIDASGSWSSPNAAGANGLPAIGEAAARKRVAYGMPDVLTRERPRYAGRTVAVLGAGHSAVGTLIELVQLKTENPATKVIWLVRGENPAKAFGGGANDKLVARGQLGAKLAELVAQKQLQVEAGFHVSHITLGDDRLRIAAGSATCCRHVIADELIVATGFRPDISFLRELRIALDPALECPPALAPLIDPNEHSCGTVRPHGARELAQPEAGFYFAGMKSYGRAPTFLTLTGYEQVRSIIADIAGDREAAERVELVLPETGVCSVTFNTAEKSSACCGGPAPEGSDACCDDDHAAKAGWRGGLRLLNARGRSSKSQVRMLRLECRTRCRGRQWNRQGLSRCVSICSSIVIFAFRVRMIAALKGLHLQEIVVLDDDTETMVSLVGKRQVPILVRDDGKAMLESMDMVRYIDGLGASVLTGPERRRDSRMGKGDRSESRAADAAALSVARPSRVRHRGGA